MTKPTTLPDLNALLDSRLEELNVEFKGWMDLTRPENRSKIAKHICGLSNYGGGYIIFGIGDDGSATPSPSPLANYRQDIINEISRKYLTPAVHCNVHSVFSSEGSEHPVVVIPSHGVQPVCGKSDGPLVEKKRVGIQAGVHYTRAPGPQTIAIDNAERWQEIIHRCVIKERDRLIAAFSGLLVKPQAQELPMTNSADEVLKRRWKESLPNHPYGVDLAENFSLFSFRLLTTDRTEIGNIELSKLLEETRRASLEVEQIVDTDTLPFLGIQNAARRQVTATPVEGYLIDEIYHGSQYLLPPTLGQVNVNGTGGEVRGYWEDTYWLKTAVENKSTREWHSGAHFTPKFQIERALSFIMFVKFISMAFHNARYAAITAEYNGLQGRTLDSPSPDAYFSFARKCGEQTRRNETLVQLDSFTMVTLADAAVELVAPTFRLFDDWKITREFALKRIKKT